MASPSNVSGLVLKSARPLVPQLCEAEDQPGTTLDSPSARHIDDVAAQHSPGRRHRVAVHDDGLSEACLDGSFDLRRLRGDRRE